MTDDNFKDEICELSITAPPSRKPPSCTGVYVCSATVVYVSNHHHTEPLEPTLKRETRFGLHLAHCLT